MQTKCSVPSDSLPEYCGGSASTTSETGYWNVELASRAQKWADTCQRGADQLKDRRIEPYRWVGQNSATGGTTKSALQSWLNQVTGWSYSPNSKGECSIKACGHFTQAAWANSWEIGCGLNPCNGRARFVCNYAPGGNYANRPVYVSGTACSQCPAGTVCQDGLCALMDREPRTTTTLPSPTAVRTTQGTGNSPTTEANGSDEDFTHSLKPSLNDPFWVRYWNYLVDYHKKLLNVAMNKSGKLTSTG